MQNITQEDKILTVYTNTLNDEQSEKYVRKIIRIASKKEYNHIDLRVISCNSQESFDLDRQQVGGKFILVTPTTLKPMGRDLADIADNVNVAETVVNMITDPSEYYLNPFTDRIMVMGRGQVGNKVCELLKQNDYLYSQCNSSNLIDSDMLTHYSAIINCTKNDDFVPFTPVFFSGKVFDLAGNYESASILDEHPKYGEVRLTPVNLEIITCGQIGSELVKGVLDEL